MPETTPLIKAALNLRVGAGFDVYFLLLIDMTSFLLCVLLTLPKIIRLYNTEAEIVYQIRRF